MAQLDEAAAVAEADVVETAPDNSAVNATQPPENDPASYYADDQPSQDDQEQIDDGDAEEEAEAVDAPASLKAEEKEQFAQLPPEAQRALSDILTRRDRETQQGLEQARSAQRDAERTAADHVATAQRDFAQRYGALIQAFQPQPPPIELARDNPSEYLYLKAQYDQDAANFGQLVQQVNGLSGQSEAHFSGRNQEWMQDQVNQLKSIPEIADESKRPEFIRGITELGKEMGYSDEQLQQADAKDIFALNKARAWKQKADKWDAHQKQRNERPRGVQGRFSSAPVGNGGAVSGGQQDIAKLMYPND